MTMPTLKKPKKLTKRLQDKQGARVSVTVEPDGKTSAPSRKREEADIIILSGTGSLFGDLSGPSKDNDRIKTALDQVLASYKTS